MSEEVVVVVSGGEPPARGRRARGPARRARDRRRQRARARARARPRGDGRGRRLRLGVARSRRGGGGGRRAHRAPPAEKDATDLELALDAALRDEPAADPRARRPRRPARPRARGAPPARRRSATPRAQIDASVGEARVHVVRGERTLAGSRASSSRCSPSTARRGACTTEGLAYPLRGETLEPGSSRGVSNVFEREDGARLGRATASSSRSGRETSRVTRRSHGLLVRAPVAARASPSPAAAAATSRRPTSCSSRTTRSRSRDEVKQAFEDESGLKLRILKAGDAGEVVTRALLTAGQPGGRRAVRRRQQPARTRARRRRLRAVRVAGARERRPGARRSTRSTA